jgi:hypothetical protein
VDPADHYLDLVKLGRDAFLASTAPAALLRVRSEGSHTPNPEGEWAGRDSTVDLDSDTLVGIDEETGRRRIRRLEVYPLAKKPSASFPDMITIGRTPNNDIVLRDATVSRLHAFFKVDKKRAAWLIADGGSKNGTFLDGEALLPRKERAVQSGQRVKIGDLELTFYSAEQLFDVLATAA